MAMSRKHYEAFAAVIRERLDGENDLAARLASDGDEKNADRARAIVGGVQLLACDMVRVLREDNPRFDAVRFANAAGLGHLIDVNRWTRGS